MGIGNAGKGRGLNLTAKLDVSAAIKEAQRLKKEISGLGTITGNAKALM